MEGETRLVKRKRGAGDEGDVKKEDEEDEAYGDETVWSPQPFIRTRSGSGCALSTFL